MQFAAASKSELIEDYIVRELLPKYRRGEKIPSELELSKELGTSRPTIHKIFSNLTAKGVLYRENGVGTFVSAPTLRGRAVSVVLPSPNDMSPERSYTWFNSQFLLEGFTSRAAKEGVHVNLSYLHPDEQPLARGLDNLLGLNTDFYLFTGLGGYGELIAGLIRHGKTCVARHWEPTRLVHTVYGEIREGVREAVAHLAASGRKHIAYVDGARENGFITERYAGYAEAMAAAGLPIEPALVRICGGFHQEAYREAREMWREGLLPDAIFAGSDIRAFGVMELLHEHGVRVPEDVALVGADNLPDCRVSDPPLSTVEYPLRRMGEGMFEILQEVAANPESPVINRGFECRFIKRESC